jgi:hypothetical protein
MVVRMAAKSVALSVVYSCATIWMPLASAVFLNTSATPCP